LPVARPARKFPWFGQQRFNSKNIRESYREEISFVGDVGATAAAHAGDGTERV
jgi:hypothetical protein